MAFRIYIPTYGRAHNQRTYEALSNKHKKKVHFVIRPEEESLFKGAKYIVCKKKGAPAARQAALEHSSMRKIILLDDDLRFARRIKDWSIDNPKLIKASADDIHDGIEWLAEKLSKEYPITGLAPRGNNNSKKERYERECDRIMRAFGVDKNTLLVHKIRFDKYPYWEDFHITLSMLKLGYKNLVNVDFVNDAVTNTQGGCSSYRKLSDMEKTRKRFLKEHGDFARPNDKSAKSWGEGFKDADTVPDMIIQWRKAYEKSSGNSLSRGTS